jgi:hypothetical protein
LSYSISLHSKGELFGTKGRSVGELGLPTGVASPIQPMKTTKVPAVTKNIMLLLKIEHCFGTSRVQKNSGSFNIHKTCQGEDKLKN